MATATTTTLAATSSSGVTATVPASAPSPSCRPSATRSPSNPPPNTRGFSFQEMNGPMRGVVTSRDGIPLAFEVHGAGAPAVVLVHGWSCDRSYWDGQVGPLAARYRTVAVDLAGHGESGSGRRAWTMAAFGEDVVAVV